MAHHEALLEQRLAAAARETAEATAADRRVHEAELAPIGSALIPRRWIDRRVHEVELAQLRQVTEATLSAKDRQHAEQVKRLEALHREQCAAYGVLQQQGGALSKLATDVGRTAEGLVVLREKMEQDLWKTVLKGEAAMLEKEGALNEVQAQREKLWAEREALVAAMRSELDAEQQRMAAAWRSGRTEWEAMQAEHNELRSQLAQRAVEIDALQQRVVAEMAGAVATLQAERKLFAQERGLCRDERSALSRALVWHRGEGRQSRRISGNSRRVSRLGGAPRRGVAPPRGHLQLAGGARIGEGAVGAARLSELVVDPSRL